MTTSRTIMVSLAGAACLIAMLYLTLSSDDASRHVIFATWGTPAEVNSFRRLVDHFNATRHPAHPVRLSHAEQSSYIERLFVMGAARSMPDVMHLDRKDLPLFVHRGLVEDLTPFIASDTAFSLSDFLPALIPGCGVNGTIYGIPHNFSTLVLYYNRDHFDAAGLSSPDSTWTWDSLRIAAQRLTRTNAAGAITRYGCYLNIIVQTLISQNGGSILNASLDSCIVASPEAEGAIRFMIDMSEQYHATWNTLAQDLLWDEMFIGGRCSMVATGRWAAAAYVAAMHPGSVGVAPLPRGRFRHGAAVNHMMVMSSESTKKQDAWAFITFLASDEAQRMVNDDGANIPARRSIVLSDAFLHHRLTPTMNNRVFLDELPTSVGWPFEQGPWLSGHTLQSQLDLVLRRVLLGQATIHQSLALMQARVNDAIALQRRTPHPVPFVGSVLWYLCCTGTLVATVFIVRSRIRRRHGT